MALPVFGQRLIYRKERDSYSLIHGTCDSCCLIFAPGTLFSRTSPWIPDKKQKIFLFDPPIDHSVNNNDIIDWIWEKRIPFFYRSAIYAEYKVS